MQASLAYPFPIKQYANEYICLCTGQWAVIAGKNSRWHPSKIICIVCVFTEKMKIDNKKIVDFKAKKTSLYLVVHGIFRTRYVNYE